MKIKKVQLYSNCWDFFEEFVFEMNARSGTEFRTFALVQRILKLISTNFSSNFESTVAIVTVKPDLFALLPQNSEYFCFSLRIFDFFFFVFGRSFCICEVALASAMTQMKI